MSSWRVHSPGAIRLDVPVSCSAAPATNVFNADAKVPTLMLRDSASLVANIKLWVSGQTVGASEAPSWLLDLVGSTLSLSPCWLFGDLASSRLSGTSSLPGSSAEGSARSGARLPVLMRLRCALSSSAADSAVCEEQL